MSGLFTKILIGGVLLLALAACDNRGEQHKNAVEARLIQSFEHEDPEIRSHVAAAVAAARTQNYQGALNRLALLPKMTHIDKEQKRALDAIIKQLRYDMEAPYLTENGEQGD